MKFDKPAPVTEDPKLEDKVMRWLMKGGESPLPYWPNLEESDD